MASDFITLIFYALDALHIVQGDLPNGRRSSESSNVTDLWPLILMTYADRATRLLLHTLTLFHPGGVSKSLPNGFRQDVETLWVLVSTLPRRILKRFPVYDITVSYADVITENGDANFTVKFLLNWKINERLIESHLSKKL